MNIQQSYSTYQNDNYVKQDIYVYIYKTHRKIDQFLWTRITWVIEYTYVIYYNILSDSRLKEEKNSTLISRFFFFNDAIYAIVYYTLT